MQVVVINVSRRPFDDTVYFDVGFCAVDVDISVGMACVAIF